MLSIDINADLGESFGPWSLGNDEELFNFLTSANLACGFHASDPLTIKRSVKLAKEKKVAIGAHPGFPDKVGFGRRDINISPDEVYADTLYQIGALLAFLKTEGLELNHVKPHGALYIKMAHDKEIAKAVASAVNDLVPAIPLIILGGSGGKVMLAAAQEVGIKIVSEAFPERAYLANGKLAPRNINGAVINDSKEAAKRAVQMVTEGKVLTLDGGIIELEIDTLCIHGDNPNAVVVARAINKSLVEEGIKLMPTKGRF